MIKESGIYCVRNLITGDLYIGQATEFNKRKNDHFNRLRKGIHHSIYFQRAYDKYGKGSFVFEILFLCEPEYLGVHEQGFVDIYNPHYNMCKICTTSQRGVKRDDETRAKLSLANKGHAPPNKGIPSSDDTKKKLSESRKGKTPNKGKIASPETRRKESESHKGQIPSNKGKQASPETKIKLSESHKGQIPWNKGKTASDDAKKKQSESQKRRFERDGVSKEAIEKITQSNLGRVVSPETRDKISKGNKDKVVSNDTRKKLSETTTAYWKKKRELGNDNSKG